MERLASGTRDGGGGMRHVNVSFVSTRDGAYGVLGNVGR